MSYSDTEHYRLTEDFLEAPERLDRHLFAAEDEGEQQERTQPLAGEE